MQIETERLRLRDFVEDDSLRVARYREDPRFGALYPPPPDPRERVRELMAAFIAWQSDKPRRYFQLAVTTREDGHLIGSVGLRQRALIGHLIQADPHGLPLEADIGYELDPAYWGQGYATEAARVMIRFGFEQLGLHRVWAYCLAENEASWRVMERLGMKREATVREGQWVRDRWWDVLVYAILADEWRALDRPGGRADPNL